MQKIGQIADSCSDQNLEFVDGQFQIGIVPTILRAAWLNTVQRELVALVEKLGYALDSGQSDQIYQAIASITPLNWQH